MDISITDAGRVLAAEAARFAGLGWMRGTAGNLSMVVQRAPLRLAVTASGIDKGSLTDHDVVLVDGDGRVVPSADGAPVPRPSAEAALHARVVALTGAGAVVHVHTVAAVVAADRHPTGVVLAGLEMLKGIGRSAEGEHVRIPVIDNSQDMAVLGDRLAAALEPATPAVIVARHGIYAWGADAVQARHHTEIVQWLLEAAGAGVGIVG